MGCYGPAGFVAALLGPNADAFVERVTAWFVVINVKINQLFYLYFLVGRPLQTAPPCTTMQNSVRQKSGSQHKFDKDWAIYCAILLTLAHNPTRLSTRLEKPLVARVSSRELPIADKPDFVEAAPYLLSAITTNDPCIVHKSCLRSI
jgi:hypothetical protein